MKDILAGSLLLALALFLAMGVTGAPFHSLADTASSTDFILDNGSVGMFGGYASSTDFQMVSDGTPLMNGNSTSSHFGSESGPDGSSDFSPASQDWQWFGDENDETPTSSLAVVNVSPSNIANADAIKLRLTIAETGGLTGSDNVKFYLEFSPDADFSADVGTVAEIASCAATSTWCYASGAGADNAVITTAVLPDANACSGSVGNGCGTHNTSGTSTSTASQAAGAATEYEFTIEAAGATPGNTYFFRAVNAADGIPVPVNGTSSYPSLVTQGATLSFSVAGLTQGTSTNGVTTNVSTTATGVPFGNLPIGSSVIGAQRLSITTNAQSGYELYAFQDSSLTDPHGDIIKPFVGTNASPLSWGSACTSTSTGCYGYHPGSPVLAGGSTRFAANDSYAGFATSSAEVGYSSFPVTGNTMDMVYRVQAGATQVNGTYANNLVYVVAPTF